MTAFKALGLTKPITDSLESMGYVKPTEIQNITIPQILNSDQDLKAFAQTGTGKTAAFSLPIIERLALEKKRLNTPRSPDLDSYSALISSRKKTNSGLNFITNP